MSSLHVVLALFITESVRNFTEIVLKKTEIRTISCAFS